MNEFRYEGLLQVIEDLHELHARREDGLCEVCRGTNGRRLSWPCDTVRYIGGSNSEREPEGEG